VQAEVMKMRHGLRPDINFILQRFASGKTSVHGSSLRGREGRSRRSRLATLQSRLFSIYLSYLESPFHPRGAMVYCELIRTTRGIP
jgi:hypothetical protein